MFGEVREQSRYHGAGVLSSVRRDPLQSSQLILNPRNLCPDGFTMSLEWTQDWPPERRQVCSPPVVHSRFHV